MRSHEHQKEFGFGKRFFFNAVAEAELIGCFSSLEHERVGDRTKDSYLVSSRHHRGWFLQELHYQSALYNVSIEYSVQ